MQSGVSLNNQGALVLSIKHFKIPLTLLALSSRDHFGEFHMITLEQYSETPAMEMTTAH